MHFCLKMTHSGETLLGVCNCERCIIILSNETTLVEWTFLLTFYLFWHLHHQLSLERRVMCIMHTTGWLSNGEAELFLQSIRKKKWDSHWKIKDLFCQFAAFSLFAESLYRNKWKILVLMLDFYLIFFCLFYFCLIFVLYFSIFRD